jgi:hypothetical protein
MMIILPPASPVSQLWKNPTLNLAWSSFSALVRLTEWSRLTSIHQRKCRVVAVSLFCVDWRLGKCGVNIAHMWCTVFSFFLFSVFRLAALVVCCVGSHETRKAYPSSVKEPWMSTAWAYLCSHGVASESSEWNAASGESSTASARSRQSIRPRNAFLMAPLLRVRNPWCETHTAYFLETTLSLRFIK